jgi:hypothetical protein
MNDIGDATLSAQYRFQSNINGERMIWDGIGNPFLNCESRFEPGR